MAGKIKMDMDKYKKAYSDLEKLHKEMIQTINLSLENLLSIHESGFKMDDITMKLYYIATSVKKSSDVTKQTFHVSETVLKQYIDGMNSIDMSY